MPINTIDSPVEDILALRQETRKSKPHLERLHLATLPIHRHSLDNFNVCAACMSNEKLFGLSNHIKMFLRVATGGMH